MKISQMVFNSQSRHQYMVEMAIFNVQRAIPPKVGNPEIWFVFCTLSHGAVHLLNFHENTSNGINLQSGHEYMVETAIFIVQRAITPELGNPKLWLMCLYIIS